MTTYAELSPHAQVIVGDVKQRFGGLYDSVDGGPHLADEVVSKFNDDTYALLLKTAIQTINGKGVMSKGFDFLSFPFGDPTCDGVATAALMVEVIRHFILSFTEVGEAQGMSGPFLDRRDYQTRWQAILDSYEKTLDEQISALDRLLAGGFQVSSLLWSNSQPFGVQARVRPLRSPWYQKYPDIDRSFTGELPAEAVYVKELML